MSEALPAIEPLSLQPLPAAAEALRAEVRAFLDEALAGVARPTSRARSWLRLRRRSSAAQLGERGWIGLTLPPRVRRRRARVRSRASCWSRSCWPRGAPVAAHWIADRQSAPLILRYGTEAQKRLLPAARSAAARRSSASA